MCFVKRYSAFIRGISKVLKLEQNKSPVLSTDTKLVIIAHETITAYSLNLSRLILDNPGCRFIVLVPGLKEAADYKDSPLDGILHKPVKPSKLQNLLSEIFLGEKIYNEIENRPKSNYILSNLENGAIILMVEDNRINQLVALKLLYKLGYRNIDIAENGIEAIEKLAQKPYDIVLMDMQMPKMNGLDATLKIRQNDKETIIIAMTANAMDGDKEKRIAAGMNDYISKPIELKHLDKTMKKWIKNK